MSLFSTNPVVVTDGVDTHSFSFRAQLPDNKSVVGEYIDDDLLSVDGSKLVVKQDENSGKPRRLFSRRINLLTADGVTYKPVTINYSIVYDSAHLSADLEKEAHNVTVALITRAEFFTNFAKGSI